MKILFSFVIVCLIAIGAQAAINKQVAGTVKSISGTALAVQNAEVRPLKSGDQVLIGDILSTGADSRLEITMIDDGSFKLGAQTSFVVVDYTFGQNNNNVIVELLNGAMDGVSGEIAKTKTDGMKVITQHATIGIRGTKFFVGELNDKLQVAHWAGGGVHVKNYAGEVFLKDKNTGTTLTSDQIIPSAPKQWGGDKKKRAKALVN